MGTTAAGVGLTILGALTIGAGVVNAELPVPCVRVNGGSKRASRAPQFAHPGKTVLTSLGTDTTGEQGL